tara:strand:- start:1008 stop:2000 length:993 start_codon:yes stop_codon:yes gene_type:complete
MIRNFILIFFSIALLGCQERSQNKIAIVIHGGAGTMKKENMTPELEELYLLKLEEAVRVGYEILKDGGTSQEAVEKTIHVMEDSPLFNAGHGAVLTSDGNAELDASFMDGETLNAGAVAGVTNVKNPISAAIAVMEKSPYVLLSSKGAEEFASDVGLELVPNSYFITERRKTQLENIQNKNEVSFYDSYIKDSKYGTVGCVALDVNGNISAGTSTGGRSNKKWGRLGDVPVIGAGTYADNDCCGISATGWGEFFIRNVVSYDIAALVNYKNHNIKEASRIALNKVKDLGGDGGVIVLDKNGDVSMDFNTSGMYRAYINNEGELTVKIYND